MNEEYIWNLIRNFVENNQLTYAEFAKIFQAFDNKEQYAIVRFIEEEFNVEMVDEKTYPREIANKPESFIRSKKEIKMSNELLIALAHGGDEQAKQDLCVKNLGLVAKIAKKYYSLYKPRMELEDLIQEGCIGLIEAAEKFDCNKDNKFSTYATWWIFQRITRAIADKGFMIRPPIHVMEIFIKIARISQRFFWENGREPTIAEIANEIELPYKRLHELLFMRDNIFKMTSLDTPVNEDEDTTLADFIPAEMETFIEDHIIQLELRERMEKILDTLTERQKEILILRFGFNCEVHTLEEIAKNFNLTRERIRQIEASALKKIRSQTLKILLE